MPDRLWTKRYVASLLVMFGLYLISGIMLSALAIFAKRLTGLDASAGMMTSLFTVGALSVRFQSGGLVDRLGGRRVIMGGISLLIVGTGVLLTSGGILQAYAARLIQGVGFGVAATATGTYISGICPPRRLMEGISYSAVAQSVTMVLGPAIGFFLIGSAYDRFGTLFWTAVALGFGTLALMLFVPGDEAERASPASANGKAVGSGPALERIRWSAVMPPVIVLFLNSITQSAVVSFLALYAISLSFTGVGVFFSINAAGMIASRFIMSKLVRRFGDYPMIILNTVVYGISVLLLTQVTARFQLMVLAFPAGFAMGSIAPIVNTFVIRQLPGNRKGLANALYFSSMDSGYALGSVGWGVVAAYSGYRAVFFAAGLIQALGIALALRQLRAKRGAAKAVSDGAAASAFE